MRLFQHRRLLCSTISALLCQPLCADVIRLIGGDTVTGTIKSKTDSTLMVTTAWAGDLAIDWQQVANIETAEPIKFMLRDGTAMTATATAAGEGKVSLVSGDIIKTAPIDLSDIDYINPSDLVSGGAIETSGHINFGLTSNRGNTDNDQLVYDTEAVARSLTNRFTIGARGIYKTENGDDTEDNNFAYLKYDHFVSDRWYGYATGDFEEDKFKDLNMRTSLGLGGGYQIFERDDLKLSVEAGASYVNEDYTDADQCIDCNGAEDEGYAAFRWATRYEQGFFNQKMQFFHKHEILSSSTNTFLRTQTGLRFPLILQLNASIQANIDWQDDPPAGNEKLDESYVMSVGYSF